MRIAICEDELDYQAAIVDAIRLWQAVSRHMDVELFVFSSSEDLLECIRQEPGFDLLFVDIQIPGEMNGVDLAKKIREAHLDVVIVFCTNYSEYVYDGYAVHALRYLKKPVMQADIDFCCSYVYNRLVIKNEQALSVVSAGRRYALRHIEIRCIEARIHSLYFSTTLSDTPLRIQAKLSDIQSALPNRLFVRCHRSYIVNIAHVRMLTRTACSLSDGAVIPISRTYAGDVNRAFDLYHQGGRIHYDLDDV